MQLIKHHPVFLFKVPKRIESGIFPGQMGPNSCSRDWTTRHGGPWSQLKRIGWCWESSASKNSWWCFVLMVRGVRQICPYQSFAWLKFMRCHITLQASCVILGWTILVQYLTLNCLEYDLVFSSQVDALQPTETTGKFEFLASLAAGLNWMFNRSTCQQSSSDKVKEQLIISLYTSCYAKHAFQSASLMVDSFFLLCHLCTRIWSLFVPHLWQTILVQFGFHCHK